MEACQGPVGAIDANPWVVSTARDLRELPVVLKTIIDGRRSVATGGGGTERSPPTLAFPALATQKARPLC